MNYDFDFNINNYTINELQKFLTLEQNYTFNDINEKCSKMNNIINEYKDYDKVYKSRLGKFLEEAKLKLVKHITPFYISNADFNDIKKIKKHKINSRNFTYDGLTFSSSVFILEEVKDEI